MMSVKLFISTTKKYFDLILYKIEKEKKLDCISKINQNKK